MQVRWSSSILMLIAIYDLTADLLFYYKVSDLQIVIDDVIILISNQVCSYKSWYCINKG